MASSCTAVESNFAVNNMKAEVTNGLGLVTNAAVQILGNH